MPTVPIIPAPDADVFLTATGLNDYEAGVSPYLAAKHLRPDAFYLSNGVKYPLWLVQHIDDYAARRKAVADLDAAVA
jgi:hypothetical protein